MSEEIKGWKLVPITPTNEMLEAARVNVKSVRVRDINYTIANSAYEELLAAAPTPPAPEPISKTLMANDTLQRDELKEAFKLEYAHNLLCESRLDGLVDILRAYRCSYTVDEDNYGMPLVDMLSPEGGTIKNGRQEIEMLADFIGGELRRSPRPRRPC